MSVVEFIYNGLKTEIPCKPEDNIEDIINKYCVKTEKKKEELYFLYSGSMIHNNSTFIELANSEDKSRKKISILVNDIIAPPIEPDLKKSKYIICPSCKDDIRIKMQNYKIELYECKNSHNFQYSSFDDFKKSQFIDQSKIICDFCKCSNKSNAYENLFYFCLSCNKNICPLCNIKHDKSHLIIDYEDKFFKCHQHNESYSLYCYDCRKNLCIICEKEHMYHNKVSHIEKMLDKNKLENQKNNLRKNLDKFENDIQNIISKLNNIVKNFEMYYNLYNDMITEYDAKKRNFTILQNLNDINQYNLMFNEELNIINNEGNINIKYGKIMNIYDKMNPEDMQDKKLKEELNAEIDSQNDLLDSILYKVHQQGKMLSNLSNTNNYENFKIEKITKLNEFESKNSITKIILLDDKRILTFNKQDGEFSVYKLQNNAYICDIYYRDFRKSINDIIQMIDGTLIFGRRWEDFQLIKLEKNEVIIITEIKIEFSVPKLCILSNEEIIIYDDLNKNICICKYSPIKKNLINQKLINTKKDGVLDVCEINKDEIAIYCREKGKLYGNNYSIIFFDLKKEQKIKTISTGNEAKMCNLNNNFFILLDSDKIYLIDLYTHKSIAKISFKYTNCGYCSVVGISKKGFIVIKDNIYYFEVEDDEKIILKGQNLNEVKCITKFENNKLIIGLFNNEIEIYEY